MALEGPLQEFSINDIISLVSLGKQTGAVEIKGSLRREEKPENYITGRLFFKGGTVCHATLADLPPLEAALTFFLFETGDFRFIQGVLPEREELRMSNEMLIMQGINRTDQWREVKDIVQVTDIPVLAENVGGMPDGSFHVDANTWRLLTIVNGQDDIATLARRSGLGEFRTLTAIGKLIKSGMVEKKARTMKYVLYAELDQLAIGQLGQPAKNLLDQSYQKMGKRPDDDIPYETAVEIVNHFRKLAALLVGPGRSERLAEQMRERVRVVYNK